MHIGSDFRNQTVGYSNTIRNIKMSHNTNWKKVGGLLAAVLTVCLAGCNSQEQVKRAKEAIVPSSSPTASLDTNPPVNPAMSPATTSADPNTPFKDAALIWGHIEKACAELDAAVDKNNFAEARVPAAKMRESLNLLSSQSSACNCRPARCSSRPACRCIGRRPN